ncbi:MAG: GNAT family N-acetyltransferase, partial [Pseudomonadota bacterium]
DEPEAGSAEIGYWLLPSHWGQGLAREAVATMVEHARTLKTLSILLARVDGPNLGSSKLLVRLGFAAQDAADFADASLDEDEVMYRLAL